MTQDRSVVPASDGDDVSVNLALAFAPLHKRALGVACGLTAGLVVFLATAVHLIVQPQVAIDLSLLAQYFRGYSVSWTGAVIGFLWGGFVGFVSGWFLAFCRNLVIAVSLFLTRTKAELAATQDFLDHI